MRKLRFRQSRRQIFIPFLHNALYIGKNPPHFIRRIYQRDPFVRFAVNTADIPMLLQISKVAGDAAFVDADVSCKLLLRNPGIPANGKHIAVMAGAKLRAPKFVRAVKFPRSG